MGNININNILHYSHYLWCALVVLLASTACNKRTVTHLMPDGQEFLSAKSLALTGTRFEKVQTVVKNYCLACHSKGKTEPFMDLWLTEVDYLESGYVRYRDLNSMLLQRTLGSGSPLATMPVGVKNFRYFEIFSDWVLNMDEDLAQHSGGPSYKTDFDCSPGQLPPPTAMQRLTNYEYKNALRDLIALVTQDEAYSNTIMTAISPRLQLLPADNPIQRFSTTDPSLNEGWVEGFIDVGLAAAKELTSSNARLEKLAGACAISTPVSTQCLTDFISRFGLYAFRRGVWGQWNQEYRDLYQAQLAQFGNRGAFEIIIAAMLNRMDFVSHYYVYGQPTSGQSTRELERFEFISRLSFFLWGSMPNWPLLERAVNRSVETPEGRLAAVEYALNHDKAKTHLRKVFAKEWLETEEISQINLDNNPAFNTFAAGFDYSQLREHAIDEILDLFDHVVWDISGGKMRDFLTNNRSFAKTDDMAIVYGVPKVTPANPVVHFPPGQRSGLLTRAAYLITGSYQKSPIRTGLRMREKVFCDEIVAPGEVLELEASMLVPQPVDPSNPMTDRQRTAMQTSAPECQVCHRNINPLGFALGKYDPLGRYSDLERIITPMGQLLAQLPVDDHTIARIDHFDETTTVTGGVELSEVIADSGKVERCFSKSVYWYAFKRRDDEEINGCTLENIRSSLIQGGFKEMLTQVALSEEFRTIRK